jgi:hypothetical protein
MQDGGTAPTAALSAFGWTPGTTALTTPYFQARIGATGPATTAAAASGLAASTGPIVGTGTAANTASNFFRSQGLYSGNFVSGNWTFNFNMRTSSATCTGQLRFRIWAGNDGTGATVTRELTSGVQSGSIIALNATGTTFNSTVTWAAPAITLYSEYLFLSVEWQETTLGTGAGANCFFYGATIGTTVFTELTYSGAGPTQMPIYVWDRLNNNFYGYATLADVAGSGGTLLLSNFPRSILEIGNNTATPIPVVVPNGPPVTVPANGVATVSTHQNIATGRSVVGKVTPGGSAWGFSF